MDGQAPSQGPEGLREDALADSLDVDCPADALGVCRRAIEPLRAVTGGADHQQIAQLLLSARACHQRLGITAEFEAYRTVQRADRKRKRNLMRIPDQHGL
ncbi:hypothetical protein AB0N14_25405 [Streptomyces sp. NPDC051104]|uniref:hypothetical protein n=1 Tax=Streptomyces sp. NPDC051104 TaxID=3155044 RepID=UPI00342005B7